VNSIFELEQNNLNCYFSFKYYLISPKLELRMSIKKIMKIVKDILVKNILS